VSSSDSSDKRTEQDLREMLRTLQRTLSTFPCPTGTPRAAMERRADSLTYTLERMRRRRERRRAMPSDPDQHHYAWMGDAAKPSAGRDRAQAWFPLRPGQVCAECEAATAVDRHHWDGNPLNNANNVVFLCRRCHMATHGFGNVRR
jgi:hypothetical protein